MSVILAPERIVILQMNSDNAMISQTEYKPDEIPKDFALEADTAYLIVETHKRDHTGNVKVYRAIYGRDAETIETFYVREDGVCIKNGTQIILK